MDYKIITTKEDVHLACMRARECKIVAIDTEFVRERTYYAQLGLIQLFAGGDFVYLIDPVSLPNIPAFIDLLQDSSVLKVLHACGEDLELLENYFNCVPTPMIDTQLMAAFLGHGLSMGFADIVETYLDISLDKGQSRTNWLARPLTSEQLQYAAADVYYLLPVYEILQDKLQKNKHLTYAYEETELYIKKRIKTVDVNHLYQDIKGAGSLNGEQLLLLQHLTIWRYNEAVEKDLALRMICSADDLIAIAKHSELDICKMLALGIDKKTIKLYSTKILAILKQVKKMPTTRYPDPIINLTKHIEYKSLLQKIKNILKDVATTSGLSTELMATKKQINQMIIWVWYEKEDQNKMPDLMQNWRLKLIGQKILNVIKSVDNLDKC